MATTLIIIIVGLFLAFAVFLYFSQGRLVFVPGRTIEVTPDEVGLAYEDLYLTSSRGEKINAWYFPGDSLPATAKTVLFCHGNAGNMSDRLETAQFLLDLGLKVMFFDYRGYGLSDGQPTEENVYADALTAYQWLRDTKHVPPGDIFIFGRSLGGAVAIELALQTESAGLVVESAFSSAADMGKLLYPFMPVKLLIRYRFDSKTRIGRVNCPVLINHSPDDALIPYEMGRTLFELAPADKRFIDLTGGHNELGYYDNPLYINGLREFFGVGDDLGSDPNPNMGNRGGGQND